MTEAEAWGQLVSLTDFESEPLTLINDSFLIGRAKDCDLPFSDNKLVSSRHCCVQRDEEGKVWLCDTSTNGTLLNLKIKITKGNRKELQHGDEFYVVFKKDEDDKNIGFVYQSMEELAKENSSEMEQTQEYDTEPNIMEATLIDSDVNVLDEDAETEDCGKKRSKETDKDITEPTTKKVKLSENEKPVTDVSKEAASAGKEKVTSEEKSALKSAGETKSVPAVDEIEETLLCSICQELLYNCISLQPCMHSYCAGCYSDWMKKSNECPTCRMKVKRINKNHIVNNLIEAYLKEHPEKKRPDEDLKELDAKNKITKEMMTPIAKEGYDNDEDVTDDEDYNDSDDDDALGSFRHVRNPQPLHLFPPRTPQLLPLPPPPAPTLFGFGTPFFGTQQATVKCRQCPGYVPPTTTPQPGIIQTAINAVGTALGLNPKEDEKKEKEGEDPKGETSGGDSQATQSLGETPGPSTSDNKTGDPELKDEKVMPTPWVHSCTPIQNHVLCQCCLQPMPDFRINPVDRPQQCSICYRNYCHAYWGCNKAECQGCIGKFKDLNFGKKCLNNLILENIYESEIFKNYLESKGITVKQVLRDSLQKLEAGEYTCPDQSRFRITSNTGLCYTCGLRNFKELAYQYRRDIPKENFPEEVQKREDCYWGKNCRTQRTRPHHAKNFSHVCDQIRTT